MRHLSVLVIVSSNILTAVLLILFNYMFLGKLMSGSMMTGAVTSVTLVHPAKTGVGVYMLVLYF